MTTSDLMTIHAAVNALTDFEGQDPSLVIEMSQAMLADLIAGDSLAPVVDYVRRYCDVIDGPSDAERIAAGITIDGSQM